MIPVEDGGGSDAIVSPLAGLTMPPGDPGPLSNVASSLHSWAGDLGNGAAGHRSAASSVIGSSWIGPDAVRCGSTVEAIATGCATLGDACDHAGTIVTEVAQRWSDAIKAWHKAQTLASEAVQDEEAHRRSGLAQLSAMTPKQVQQNPDLVEAAENKADGGDGYQSPLRPQALAMGQAAVKDANHAITVGANALDEIAAIGHLIGGDPFAAHDSFLAVFMDMEIGGFNTVAAIPVLASQVASWQRWITFMRAFENRDYATLAKLDPKGWQAVLDAEKEFGDDSSEYVRAAMAYLEKLSRVLKDDAGHTVLPIGELPGGTTADILDILGKGAAIVNVGGDLYTIFAPGHSTLNRTLSIANLGGAALTTDTGADLAAGTMELVGIDTATGWIPVAGWIIVGGTAIYMSAEWIQSHWSEVEDWGKAAGHFVTSTLHGAAQEGSKLASEGWHAIEQGAKTGVAAGGAPITGGGLLGGLLSGL